MLGSTTAKMFVSASQRAGTSLGMQQRLFKQGGSSFRWMSSSTQGNGTVRWFNHTKGFGFIMPNEAEADGPSDGDLFVHVSNVAGNQLNDGDVVSYEKFYDERRNKYNAVNVTGGTGEAEAAPREERAPLRRAHAGGGGMEDDQW